MNFAGLSAAKFGASPHDNFGRWCERRTTNAGNPGFGGILSSNSFGNPDIRMASNCLVDEKSNLTSTIPQPASSYVSNNGEKERKKESKKEKKELMKGRRTEKENERRTKKKDK